MSIHTQSSPRGYEEHFGNELAFQPTPTEVVLNSTIPATAVEQVLSEADGLKALSTPKGDVLNANAGVLNPDDAHRVFGFKS